MDHLKNSNLFVSLLTQVRNVNINIPGTSKIYLAKI